MVPVLRQASAARANGIAAEPVSPEQAVELFPPLYAGDLAGAVYYPDDGRGNATDTTMALAAGARQHGVRIVENTRVTGVTRRDGRVAGVTTEHGDLEAEYVVAAAGMWGREFGALAGVGIPLQALAHYYVITEAIPAPRPEVAESAPKIISFQIPMDRIGEVIGPKGKVINSIQQETGADVNVDDDGQVGTVTIGGRDGGAVAEAKRMIELILNPPEADVGGIYNGKVVNITKFGAFVNILPGRDGLLHISKLGSGKRVDRVEDVLSLGTEVEVRVDDIDPQGKVSLSLIKPLDGSAGESGGGDGEGGGGEGGRGPAGDRDVLTFDADWDQTARDSFGDLGPAEASPGGGGRSREGGDRDRDRGGRDRGRRPGGGGGRGRR